MACLPLPAVNNIDTIATLSGEFIGYELGTSLVCNAGLFDTAVINEDEHIQSIVSDDWSIEIYPNPMMAVKVINCNVHSPAGAKGETMEIASFNIKGQRLYHAKEPLLAIIEHNVSIPVPSLASGLYLCKVKVGAQEKVTKFTIVK